MSCPFACLEPILNNRVVATVAGVGATAVVAKVVVDAVAQRRRTKAEEERRAKHNKPGVVYLYQWPGSQRLHSVSTFCTVVETYLRLTETKYEVVDVVDASMSPTGRLPYVELDGVGIADSEFIIESLAAKLGHRSVPAGKFNQAVSTMLVRTLNHSLRLHFARHMWVDHPEAMRAEFMTALQPFGTPGVVVAMLVRKMRGATISLLNAEGQGDLSHDEYHAKFLTDVKAVESTLAAFADGTVQLSQAAIATAFTYLSYLVVAAPECPAVHHAAHSGTIKQFLHMIDAKAYPDASKRVPGRQVFHSA